MLYGPHGQWRWRNCLWKFGKNTTACITCVGKMYDNTKNKEKLKPPQICRYKVSEDSCQHTC